MFKTSKAYGIGQRFSNSTGILFSRAQVKGVTALKSIACKAGESERQKWSVREDDISRQRSV